MDIFSKAKRSWIMGRIKGKETSLEIKTRKWLFSQGKRFRKNVKDLPGCPDIVLKKYNLIIFINGCFWHGHKNCKYFKLPKSNKKYWKEKILKNIARDIENKKKMKIAGWNILILWECKLKENFEKEMIKIKKKLTIQSR